MSRGRCTCGRSCRRRGLLGDPRTVLPDCAAPVDDDHVINGEGLHVHEIGCWWTDPVICVQLVPLLVWNTIPLPMQMSVVLSLLLHPTA